MQRAWSSTRRTPGAQVAADLGAILFGDAKQIRDGQRRKGFAVFAEELAAAVGDELVELAVCETPDVVLVLLQAARSQQAAQ